MSVMPTCDAGNYALARVLPSIYVVKKEPIHDHLMALISLLPLCESSDKLNLLALFELVAKHKPSVSFYAAVYDAAALCLLLLGERHISCVA